MNNIQVHLCLIWPNIIAAVPSPPSPPTIHPSTPFCVRLALTGCWAVDPLWLVAPVTSLSPPSLFLRLCPPLPLPLPSSAGCGCSGLKASQQASMTGSFNAAAAAISSPLMSSEGGAGPHAQSGESQPEREREREEGHLNIMLFVPMLSHETLKPSWTYWSYWADVGLCFPIMVPPHHCRVLTFVIAIILILASI